MSIFKTYDIRGIYPKELNEELAYKIGRAFVLFLGCKKVVIGRDCRLSSDSLFDALAKGIMDQGADVVDIGLSSSPMLYFASAVHGDSGIMISASHNPKQFNGFKLCRNDAIPISGDTGIKDIEKLVEKNSFPDAEKGNISSKEVVDEYVQHMLKFQENISGLKLGVDTANAMGGVAIPGLLEKIDCIPSFLYLDFDGNFPNHEANPLNDETLVELQKKVIEQGADFGVAFDGDADRCRFIDEKGMPVENAFITVLIAEYLLEKNPGAKILYDVRSSKIIKEIVSAKGGTAVPCRIGHALIKEQMRKQDALFAGELSGHFYIKNNFFAESEGIPVLIIMDLLCKKKIPFSKLVEPLKKYFTSGEINSDVADKDAKIKELEKKYNNGKISKIDGLSVEYSDWWFNVRKSNTEPVLRLNVEADTKKLMQEKRDELLSIIQEAKR